LLEYLFSIAYVLDDMTFLVTLSLRVYVITLRVEKVNKQLKLLWFLKKKIRAMHLSNNIVILSIT